MKLVQFNARIAPELRQKMRMDAARFGKSTGAITSVIFRRFFLSFGPNEREKIYSATPARKGGKKL